MKSIDTLLSHLRRKPGDLEQLRSPERLRFQTFIFLTMLSVALALAGTFLASESKQWLALKVDVPIPNYKWKVLFTNKDCPADAHDCPADPENQSLWQSPLDRSSPNYRPQLQSRGKSPIWVGTHIHQDDLRIAIEHHADILYLGQTYAPHSIWINGQRTSKVDVVLSRPIMLQLRSKEWNNIDGAFIAIRFENINNYHYPELFTFEPSDLGFIRPDQQASLYNLTAVTEWARPVAFGFANFLIAFAFFIFWRNEPIKQEYFIFSAYALIQSITQLLKIQSFIIWLASWRVPIELCTNTWEAAYPALLGLSFIRARRSWTKATAILIAFFSILVPILSTKGADWIKLDNIAYSAVAPFCSIIGSLLCLFECNYVKGLSEKRQYRLLGFSGSLSIVAVLYAIFGKDIASSTTADVWEHLAHFLLTAVLGAVIFSDFNELVTAVRISPLTQFHLNKRFLGKPVPGTVIFFDLKRSEQLTTQSQCSFDRNEILHRAMYPFRLAWSQFGGLEINGDGDGIKVFFPEVKTPIDKIVRELIPRLLEASEALTTFLRNDGITLQDWQARFRASIAYGSVIPALKTIGNKESAEWQDGPEQPFVSTARLLEIEKTHLDPKKEYTHILYTESAFDAVRSSAPELVSALGKKLEFTGKHDKKWILFAAPDNSTVRRSA